jgi:hypothetical protein
LVDDSGLFVEGSIGVVSAGFSVASVSPPAGPIRKSEEEVFSLACGAGNSPDSVDGFFEERDVSDGEGVASEGTTKLVEDFDSLAGNADSTITFPYMSTGMRRVTSRGTSCISVVWTVFAIRCGT